MQSTVTRKHLLVFFSLLVAVSWAVQLIAIGIVRDLSSSSAEPWLLAMMFFPTIASLIYWLAFNRKAFAHIRFWPGNPLYLFLGAIIPALTAFAVLAVVLAAGWGTSEYFDFTGSVVEVKKGPWSLGVGSQSWVMFMANIAVTAVVFSLINSVAAVGEEFAWRGFLQKPMIENFGILGGVSLLGLVWAYWHLPSNLAGYNYPHAPVLGGLVLFPALLVADSFVMAWLTIRAGSFWPAVLMHASGNGIHESIVSRITLSEGVSRLWIDAATIGAAWVFGGLCAYSLYRKNTNGRNGKDFVLPPLGQ